MSVLAILIMLLLEQVWRTRVFKVNLDVKNIDDFFTIAGIARTIVLIYEVAYTVLLLMLSTQIISSFLHDSTR